MADFQHPFFSKIGKKLRVDPSETLKKLRKKVSLSRKKSTQKKFGQGRDSNSCPSAWQTTKSFNLDRQLEKDILAKRYHMINVEEKKKSDFRIKNLKLYYKDDLVDVVTK